LTFILPLLVLLPLFYGCEDCTRKQVTCLGYQEPAANWFPYTLNQKIIFSFSGARDTITFATIQPSQAYDERVSASNPWCSATKQWLSSEKDPGGIFRLSMSAEQMVDAYGGTREPQGYWQLSLHGSSFTGKGIADTGIMRNSSNQTSQYYQTQSIGGTPYSMVQVIMYDTTVVKTPRIYKVWLARDHGIVAYEEYPSKNLWVKQ
jgi:hypothetical protein